MGKRTLFRSFGRGVLFAVTFALLSACLLAHWIFLLDFINKYIAFNQLTNIYGVFLIILFGLKVGRTKKYYACKINVEAQIKVNRTRLRK